MYFNRFTRWAGASSLLVALVIGFVSLQTNLTLPGEISKTAAAANAMTGGGCDKNANITVRNGSVLLGETEASKHQRKTCTDLNCFQTDDGKTVCLITPEAQALANGGNTGLMSQIGQIGQSLFQQLMGGEGGSGGYSAPSEYTYDKKPECSSFISSSGTKPVEAGASIFLTWIRTGGEIESASVTPGVGIATLESPLEMKAPTKSTTYTLTLTNRSGSSTCSTRVFIGPRGSAITDAEDLAYLAANPQIADTPVETLGRSTTPAPQTATKCKKNAYSDLDLECVAREKAQQDIVTKAAAAQAAAERAAMKRSDVSITGSGVVDPAYIDRDAFMVDRNAFVEDPNAFVEDLGLDNANQVNARGEDLDALEARMRALMYNKKSGADYQYSAPSARTGVHVTGGLGEMRSEDYTVSRTQPTQPEGVFGKIGAWVRGVFCFWCVAPQARTQGGAVLLAQATSATTTAPKTTTPPPSFRATEDASMKKLEEQKKSGTLFNEDKTGALLTNECKSQHEKRKKEVCDSESKPSANAACKKSFDDYTHPEAVIPVEFANPVEKKQGLTEEGIKKSGNSACKMFGIASVLPLDVRCISADIVKSCKRVADVVKECATSCREQGYSDVTKVLDKNYINLPLSLCSKNPKESKLMCRKEYQMSQKFSGNGNLGSTGGGDNDPSGFGGSDKNSFLQDAMNSQMGQGVGQGAGMGAMDQLGKLIQGGQGGGGSKQDPCTLANAQYNPACNPTLPTTAPSCGAVTVKTVSTTSPETRGNTKVAAEPSGEATTWLGGIRSYFWSSSAKEDTVHSGTPRQQTQKSTARDDALSVSPSVIPLGDTATLSWKVEGKGKIVTTVTYSTTDKDGREIKGTLGSGEGALGSKDVSPDRSTTYTLKATNEIGSVTCTPERLSVRPRTVADDEEDTKTDVGEVDTLLAKQFTLRCEPNEYVAGSGGQPSVSWSGCPKGTESTFGTSTEDGAFTTGGDIEGEVDVAPRRDATYVVRCRDKNSNELARNACRIDVVNAAETRVETTSKDRPFVDIYVKDGQKDAVVAYGESVRVEWRSQQAASCVIYGPGCTRFGRSSNKCFKELGRSGFVTGNIYETSEFVAECRGADRQSSTTDKVTVTIAGEEVQPQVTDAPVDTQSSVSTDTLMGDTAGDTSLDDLLNGL